MSEILEVGSYKCNNCGNEIDYHSSCCIKHWEKENFSLCNDCIKMLFLTYFPEHLQIVTVREKITEELRAKVLNKYGNKCVKCGLSGEETNLALDHITPFVKGGLTNFNNLQPLCRKCNSKKGDKL